MVIADISRMLFLSDTALLTSFLPFNTLSKNLSDNRTNSAPVIKPTAGNSHAMYPSSSDSSIEGASSDQNDAAIITPALKPKIVFSTFLFTVLKKHTVS